MNYSATYLAERLDISRSYLYHLKDSGVFEQRYDSGGKLVWDEDVYQQILEYLSAVRAEREPKKTKREDTIKIQNRRFLGNKFKLLDFIRNVVDENCENVETVADIFAGTGSVASAFLDKKIITNDNMYSNYICHVAWFGNEKYSDEIIENYIDKYNSITVDDDNYVSKAFANTYFSLEDCRKIGFIREDIEQSFAEGKINERERAILITSLIYAMDKIANTCGHYDAYRRGARFEKHIKLMVPKIDKDQNGNNKCFNMDANELVKSIEADLVYIDPPYNSRQYCDAYHLLENIAMWDKPEVHGVARKMDRGSLKSDYCTKKAAVAFEDLIKSIKAKYILLSYNNMAVKGNDRSNAKISDDEILRILREKGEVKVFSLEYKAFTTGKSDIKDNKERLFLCKCYDQEKDVIASPFNYTGGKHKLLPQMLPVFPKTADKFVDLFCGGCNVGTNVACNSVLFNDSNEHLMGMVKTFAKMDKEEIFTTIFRIIEEYQLSRSWEKGYEYYGCQSSQGLANYNRSHFLKLREDFNGHDNKDDYYYLMLFTLIVYSFNNQLRFNRKGEFNLPVGKRDFNPKMQTKLATFVDRLQSGNYSFASDDFRNLDIEKLTHDSFVYADPPYLITCASYNEQNGWTERDEYDLLDFLDELDRKGVKFALSNVLESKGRTNRILAKWVEDNVGHYNVIHVDSKYTNSNYHRKQRAAVEKEVLIINY